MFYTLLYFIEPRFSVRIHYRRRIAGEKKPIDRDKTSVVAYMGSNLEKRGLYIHDKFNQSCYI